MKTIAEQIAERFPDGQVFTDENGVELEAVCDEKCWQQTRSGEDITKWEFSDGSVITSCGVAWDLGYQDCFCWKGNGHSEDCENVC